MSGTKRRRALHLEYYAYPTDAQRQLDEAFELTDGSHLSSTDLADALIQGSYEVLFVRLGTTVTHATVANAPNLRLLVTPTTGLDHLDLDGLNAQGIRVLSLRDARTEIVGVHATAEHTWALLLATVRHIPSAQEDVAQGNWRRRPFLGTELAGRTIGIIGYGRLGRRVASYAHAFGMRILAHDTDPAALADLAHDASAVDPTTLLRSSDVISIHLPLNDQTRGWLSAERIGLLRHHTFVINTSRGEIIDENALADALASGRIAGVGVDVVANDANWTEVVGDSPLLAIQGTDVNLVITPHIGGWARDAVSTTRRLVTKLAIKAIGAPDPSLKR